MAVSFIFPTGGRIWVLLVVVVAADNFVRGADSLKIGAQPGSLTTKVSKPPLPKRDPPDQPFRRAPMAESPRSIAIPLGTNLHLAFDTQLLRTHTAWSGPSLNLFGPPYHGGKEPFICAY